MLFRSSILQFVAAIALLCALAGGVTAQPPNESPPKENRAETRPANGRPAEIREEKPDVYYLRDEKGNLVLVPTFSFEEWERLMKLDIGRGPAQPPPYTFLGESSLAAVVTSEHVNIEARFRVRLAELPPAPSAGTATGEDERWVRVPLRFGNAALTEPPKSTNNEGLIVEFDPKTESYVAWFHGKGGSEHDISLRLVRPIQRAGDEKRLTLACPPVPTRMSLQISAPRATAEVLNATTSILKTEHSAGATTTVTVVGASGDFQVGWRDSGEKDTKVAPVLEATGLVTVRVEGQQRVRSDVRLRVRSLGMPIDGFTVRLPTGMRLAAEAANSPSKEYELSTVEAANDVQPADRVAAVRVQLPKETAAAVEVRIPLEYSASSPPVPAAGGLEVAGYEVVGAVRQSGYVDLIVEGDLAVRWREGAKLNRVDEIPDVPKPANSAARFEYFAQPCSLQLEVTPKRVRATVEAIYVVDVQTDRLDLTAIYRYSVGGGKVDRLRFDFAGWTVQRVSPSNLPVPDLALEPLSPFVVPLAFEAQGNFEVQIHASRPLAGNLRFAFGLPRPLDATLTPATLAVISADNVEINPRNEELRGLVPESLPPSVNLPSRQQPPLYFREQGPAAVDGRPTVVTSQFSGDMRIRERSVGLTSDVSLTVSEQVVQVTETFTLQIAYVPLRSLVFTGPRALWESGKMQITADGTALPFGPVEDSTGNQADDSPVQMRVDLLENRLGTCSVRLQYVIPVELAAETRTAEITVALLLPVPEEDVNVGPTSLHVVRPENLQVSLRGSDWTEVPSAVSRAGQLDFESSGALTPAQTVLALRRAASTRGTATVVHRAWWQTWLTASERRDRVAWRFSSSERDLRLLLPPNASLSNVEVACNKQPCSATVGKDGELIVRLPEAKGEALRVLELFCWMPRDTGKGLVATLEMPRIAGVDRVERLFWEIALPPNEHLINGPPSWVPEFHWQWQAGLLVRVPNEASTELEGWVGASRQENLPAAVNRYLFSTLGQVERVQVWTATRPLLAVTVIGPILLIGLLGLLYLDWMRPVTLSVLGTLAAALSFVFPETAVLFAQLATLAFALLLLARLLQVRLPQRATLVTPQGGSTMVRAESPLSDLMGPATSAGSHVTTATVPVAMPLSAAEPKS